MEPLLSGVPVVATNVGGLPDLIIPGKTGWLVPPRNPEALAAAILDALRNPEEARARALAGQARARCMFDVEITARGVASAYETMLAQRLDSIHVQVQPSAATVPSEKRVLIRAVREKTSHPLT